MMDNQRSLSAPVKVGRFHSARISSGVLDLLSEERSLNKPDPSAEPDPFHILRVPTAELPNHELPGVSVDDELPMVPLESVRSAELPMLRQRVKPYRVGALVEVFSLGQQKWFADGEVTDVVTGHAMIEGTQVRAGSVRVLYDGRMRFKWVAPQEVGMLRPLRGPKPPPPAHGVLFMRQDSWVTDRWIKLHLTVRRGVLELWLTAEEIAVGAAPVSSLDLIRLQQVSLEGPSLGIVHEDFDEEIFFRALRNQDVEALEAAVWIHMQYREAVKMDEMRRAHGGEEQEGGSAFRLPGVAIRRRLGTSGAWKEDGALSPAVRLVATRGGA